MPPHAVLALAVAVVSLAACAPLDRTDPERTACPPIADEPGPFVPLIDGHAGEWTLGTVAVNDPAGDAPDIDITRLRATNRGDRLVMQIDTAELASLLHGEGHGPLLTLELPDDTLLIEPYSRRAWLNDVAVPWSGLNLVIAPSHAATSFELRLDLPSFASFDSHGNDALWLTLSGADEVTPVRVPLRFARDPAPRRDLARSHASLRVVSFDLAGGLDHATHAGPLSRLLRAADADVYLLQHADTERALAILAEAQPDREHQAHARGGNAIIAGAELEPVASAQADVGDMDLADHVVAASMRRDGRTWTFYSVQLPSGGYFGSAEDSARMRATDALGRLVLRHRDRRAAERSPTQTPTPAVVRHVVVGGDFQHIGSPGLLAPLTGGPMGLVRSEPPHLGAHDVFTSDGEILDAILHDPRLSLARGFVLDTTSLDDDTLRGLLLWGSDSDASDHLLVAVDLTSP